MKLISCHIENFGRLSDFSCEFAEGINVICEENGWGKSTFAAFIRAMFYGLEGERKRNPAENERKKYRPWQGGVFGGQLVFEMQGKQYQISRIFYEKDMSDEFELRDAATNLPSEDYSRKIGEEIFQIDRESFLRTVFIGQNECRTSSTDDINARLGNPADGANGLDRFDDAYTRLTEIVNTLTPARASGQLAKRKEEIARLERICKEGEGIEESMAACRERMRAQEENYNTLKENLKEAGRWQERVTQMQSVSAEKSEWLRLKNMFEQKKQEEAAAAKRFPKEVPALSEVKEQIAQCSELGRAYDRASLCQLSEKEEKQLTALEKVFWNRMPTAAELDAKIREASGLAPSGQEQGAGAMSRQEKKRLAELAPYFVDRGKNSDGAADASALAAADASALMAAWEERNKKKAKLPSDQDVLAELLTEPAPKKPRKKLYSFLFFAGIVIAAVGIVTASMFSLVPGMLVAFVGFLVTAVSIHKKVAMQMPDEEANAKEEMGLRGEDIIFVKQTDAKVDAFLKAHGREFGDYDEQEIGFVLREIMTEATEYQALLKKAQNMQEGGEDAEPELNSQSIAEFLGRYNISVPQERYTQELYSLKEQAATYAALADKQDKFEEARSKYEKIRGGIVAFYEKYGIEPERNILSQLNRILDAVYDYETAAEAFDHAAGALEQFEAENDVSRFKREDSEPDERHWPEEDSESDGSRWSEESSELDENHWPEEDLESDGSLWSEEGSESDENHWPEENSESGEERWPGEEVELDGELPAEEGSWPEGNSLSEETSWDGENFQQRDGSGFADDSGFGGTARPQEMLPSEEMPSLEDIHEAILELNEEMERVREERAQAQKVFDELQEQYDVWEESCVKLAQLKEIQEIQQKKYEHVYQARAKLVAAKEAMTAKYAAPILEGFSRYYELLAGKSAERFHVDANAQVTVDEFGKQRGIGMFSMGQRDLAGICLRLAFVDAMYPQEAPVLVMDDPFTNFDDEKIAAGSAFLAEVAKKYQIIYFTCSKTRSMGVKQGGQ